MPTSRTLPANRIPAHAASAISPSQLFPVQLPVFEENTAQHSSGNRGGYDDAKSERFCHVSLEEVDSPRGRNARPPSASEPRTPAQRDPGASPKGAGKASRIGQHAAAHLPLEEEAGACHAEKEEADAGAARCESQGPGRGCEICRMANIRLVSFDPTPIFRCFLCRNCVLS